jgi:hypothetical protein
MRGKPQVFRVAPHKSSSRTVAEPGSPVLLKGLSRRCLLTGNIALGYGSLFDRENWLACVTIEHIQKPCLVSLDDDWNVLSVAWQCRQQGR